MTSEYVCLLCGQPVDPEAPTTMVKVTGFANTLIDKVVEIKPTGDAFAHEACVEEAERARALPRHVDGGL